jgi:VWFA-related protein
MKRYFCLFLLFPPITLLSTSSTFCQSVSQGTVRAGKFRFAVVVSDSHGAPIRDLHSDDFVIEVAGKAQPGQVQSPVAAAPQASASSANNGRGLVVVVIDTIHTFWGEQADVRRDAEKYLAVCAKRNAPVSLLVLSQNGKLNPVHEYTTNSGTLTAALERADAEMHHRTLVADASPEVVAEARRFVDFYKGAGNFASSETTSAYPEAILDEFTTVARYVVGIPGRKSLIWINSIVPFAVYEKRGTVAFRRDDDPLNPALQAAWKESIGAVQRSELALFPVLTRHSVFIQLDKQILHNMESLADITGGQEENALGDVFAQFGDLQEINMAAYEVVLSPEAARECKSDWCDLKITVNRSGAHVLAPHGFFRDASVVPPETSVAAARLPTEPDPGPNPIPFTVTWRVAERAGAKKKIPFVVSFGPTAGIPAEGSTELNLEITVHAISNKTDKQAIEFGAKTQLSSVTLDQIRAKGFVLNNAIELEPGDYDVRFVVQDKISGRSGILSVPLKVS